MKTNESTNGVGSAEGQNEQLRPTAVSGRLTVMQSFFLNTINSTNQELNPAYLAALYYEWIGKPMRAASRDSFGQTSAAYRTCRKLASLNLIKEIQHRTSGGYSYTTYTAFH